MSEPDKKAAPRLGENARGTRRVMGCGACGTTTARRRVRCSECDDLFCPDCRGQHTCEGRTT